MENRLALITGASGGIGEAFAQLLAAEGFGLILVARRDRELHRVKGVIASKHSVPVHIIALDLNDRNAVEKMAEELLARNLVPTLVVNNAGFGLVGKADELSRQGQLEMIDVNIRVLTDLTLRYLPGMVAAKAGGVINVSSVAGFMPGPMMAIYFATKNYVLSFGEALSEELKGTGVTITTLCPGIVKTGFQARAGMPEVRSRGVTPRDVVTEAWEGHKLQRRVVIPGFFNKISAYGMRLAPRSLVLPVVKRVMGKRR